MLHRFEATRKAFSKEKREIGDAIYNDVHKPSVRKLVDALPENWLDTSDDVSVMVGENRYLFHTSVSRRIPYKQNKFHTPVMKVYAVTDPIGERIIDYRQRRDRFNEEKNSAKAKIGSAIFNFGSPQSLKNAWPEIATFVDRVFAIAGTSLPAIDFAGLNKDLGLPPATEPETVKVKRKKAA